MTAAEMLEQIGGQEAMEQAETGYVYRSIYELAFQCARKLLEAIYMLPLFEYQSPSSGWCPAKPMVR